MTPRLLIAAGLVVVTGALAWALFVVLPRRHAVPPAATVQPAAPAAPVVPGRRIKARLFYVSEDGTTLTAIERDVPFADNAVDQAREIAAAQVAPVALPLVSPVPAGTVVRSVFISPSGQAYVDLSREVQSAHSGGTLAELLTVYSLVDALTVNLPAISAVQLLVDGKEADTLAGHVDVRRPLQKNLAWVQ